MARRGPKTSEKTARVKITVELDRLMKARLDAVAFLTGKSLRELAVSAFGDLLDDLDPSVSDTVEIIARTRGD